MKNGRILRNYSNVNSTNHSAGSNWHLNNSKRTVKIIGIDWKYQWNQVETCQLWLLYICCTTWWTGHLVASSRRFQLKVATAQVSTFVHHFTATAFLSVLPLFLSLFPIPFLSVSLSLLFCLSFISLSSFHQDIRASLSIAKSCETPVIDRCFPFGSLSSWSSLTKVLKHPWTSIKHPQTRPSSKYLRIIPNHLLIRRWLGIFPLWTSFLMIILRSSESSLNIHEMSAGWVHRVHRRNNTLDDVIDEWLGMLSLLVDVFLSLLIVL